MHFPDRRPDPTEARILPLINVVFLLLIFFMIAGSLSSTEPFEVSLPDSTSQEPHQPDSIIVLMGINGHFAFDNEAMTQTQLLLLLEQHMQARPETFIVLKADSSLPANQLVLFTQALYKVGVEQLQLLVEPL